MATTVHIIWCDCKKKMKWNKMKHEYEALRCGWMLHALPFMGAITYWYVLLGLITLNRTNTHQTFACLTILLCHTIINVFVSIQRFWAICWYSLPILLLFLLKCISQYRCDIISCRTDSAASQPASQPVYPFIHQSISYQIKRARV